MLEPKPIPIEEQFRIMAEDAPVMIWISDIDKQLLYFNARWLRFRGRILTQEHGYGWIAGIHPDDLKSYLDTYQSSFDARKEFKTEYRLRRYDDKYRWVLGNGTPRYTTEGDFAGYVGTCTDIEELIETGRLNNERANAEALKNEQALNEELAAANEELYATNTDLQQSRESLQKLNDELEEIVNQRTKALLESESNFRNMILQAPVPMALFKSEEMVIEIINDQFLELWGKDRSVVGKPLLTASPELRDQPYLQIMQHVYKTGTTYYGNESSVFLNRNGKIDEGFYNFINQPFSNADGEITGIIVVASEVTSQVLAGRELQALNQDLAITNTALKQSEYDLNTLNRELRSGEKKLEQILNRLPSHIVVLRGPELIVETTNDALLSFWNKKRDEITGKTLLEVLPELINQPFPEQLKHVLKTGQTIDEKEIRVLLDTPGGGQSESYVDYIYEPITDADGNRTGVLVMSFEVTDKVVSRKLLERYTAELQSINEEMTASNEELVSTNEELAETRDNLQWLNNELAESESRFRLLVQHAPVAIGVLTGRNLVIESANDIMLNIWGKSTGVIGMPLATALPELQGQPYLKLLDDVYTSGQPYYGNEAMVILEHEGELGEYYFDFIYQPIEDAGGGDKTIMVVATDVTEQLQSRKELERTYEQARLSKEAAQLGTFDMDLKLGTLEWDERCRILFGIDHTDTVTYENDFVTGLHPDDRERILKVINNAFIKELTNGDYDVEYRTIGANDQKLRWVRAKGKVYFDKNDKPVRFIGSVLDITEQKQDEQRKNDFIGMVSHELKTPLTSLTAIIQVLNLKLRNSADPFVAGAMDKANAQAKKMSSMINGFLNISRLESGKILVVKQYFNLNDLLTEMISETELVVTSHIINFTDSDTVVVFADRDKIGSVVSNLLSNAIKYSPKGRIIDVKCGITDNKAQVSIRDEGMGIKQHDLKKLFDRYYRVESNHTRNISGFGIGLYLSAEIIHRHDGEIWAESESGTGSTFYFTLPIS